MTTDNDRGAAARDARTNAYLRQIAPQEREALRIGPFLATFHPTNANPYVSYAIPDDGARPTSQEIQAFVEAARARDRTPRLEYAPQAAPDVEAALLAAGFEVDFRPPFMTCDQPIPVEAPAGTIVRIVEDPQDLRATARVLDLAYAEHGYPAMHDDDRLIAFLANGGGVALASDAVTGEAAGGGMFTPIAEAMTEVAGIGVLPGFRRRGLASALTALLTAEAFRRGAQTAFLTPGGEHAQKAYQRAGFRAGGEMLMLRKA